MQEIENKAVVGKRSPVIAGIRLLITFITLVLFLSFTQPDALPIVGLLVPFLLLFVLVFQVLLLIATYRNKSKVSAKQLTAITVLSVLPVVVLVLSSLNQLSRVDIAIVLLFMAGIYFYLQYFNLSLK